MHNLFLCLSVLGAAAFLATWALTQVVRGLLLKRAILDRPNERSMHAAPVPRGAGLAVLAVLALGLGASLGLNSAFFQNFTLPPAASPPGASPLWLLLAATGLAGLSWLDDRYDLPPGLRLGAHLAAATMGSLSLPATSFLSGGLAPFWIERPLLILAWAWFVNLYNFMDGIDGITGAQTICLALGAASIAALTGLTDPFFLTLATLLAGTSAGFLMLNWHRAKIFLGDVGSVPLGFLTGYLLWSLAAHGFRASAAILPLYYLADSGITLAKRIARREKFWKPHRQHFYQRAAQGAGRHDRIVLWILSANAALILAAVAAVDHPAPSLAAAVATVALLLRRMHNVANTQVPK